MPDRKHIRLPQRRPLDGHAAVAAILVVLIASASAVVFFVTRDREVAAPALLGISLTEAAAVADQNGVGLIVVGAATPAGVVAGQQPAPGTAMQRGDVIAVSLAEPPREVIVPDVRGVPRHEAELRLSEAGLRLGALREDQTSADALGAVTRQNPSAGAVSFAGTAVDVWIAGVAPASVPDLAGLTEQEALAAAAAVGLAVDFLSEVTDEVLPGLVFKQSPRQGERVAPGSAIVAILNAAPASYDDDVATETGSVPPPTLFANLDRSYPFQVLYPSRLPSGLVVEVGPNNPGHRVGPMGTQGFEVVYTDPARPEVRLSLLEGDWFDPGLDRSTTVDVRGNAAGLGAAADKLVIVWSELGTMYALSALGLEESELVSVAQGLMPLPHTPPRQE